MRVLNAGCGISPICLPFPDLQETRLDLDPEVKPDIVADMCRMGDVGEYEMVVCSHSLEHLVEWDVWRALREFHRVLRPGGAAIVVVPDMEGVSDSEEILYEGAAGPVTGKDMLHGFRSYIMDHPLMRHRTWFSQGVLDRSLKEAGFRNVEVLRGEKSYNLLGIGYK